MQSKAPLLEALQTLGSSAALPMHMPGHKRNTQLANYLAQLGAGLDITEIDGFDNLHQAEGILLRSMEQAAALWGARRSFYLINGSTGGLLAALRAMTSPGQEILLTRGCHKSIYHGLELLDLVPRYLAPPLDAATGIMGSITPQQLEQALKQWPRVSLLVLTCPTYEGVLCNLPELCRIAHRHNIPVLVDEAHGPHLGLAEGWPQGAVAAGADVVVQSLHKTLPSLTQTAILHCCTHRVDVQRMGRELAIFQTSSPSYLLMASMDGCTQLLTQQGPELLGRWRQALAQFDQAILPLKHLKVLCHGADRLAQHPALFDHDPSKLVLCCRGTSITGPQLMEQLRSRWGIELEMALGDYAIAMTGLGDTWQTLEPLAQALLELDKTLQSGQPAPVEGSLPLPPMVCSIRQALSPPGQPLGLEQAVGWVSTEFVWAYPPGIPLIVPGEQVDSPFVATCKRLLQQGVALHSTSGGLPGHLLVCSPSHCLKKEEPLF